MSITINIPAHNGYPASTVELDFEHKVRAIKAVREAAGMCGLRDAKLAVDAFFESPLVRLDQAEAKLVNFILDQRHSDHQAEVATLRRTIERLQSEVAEKRSDNADLREQVDGLRREVAHLANAARSEAERSAFPVVYHGSFTEKHGIWTAFPTESPNAYDYVLVHPSGHERLGADFVEVTRLPGAPDEF